MQNIVLSILLSVLCFYTQAKSENYQKWSDLIDNKSFDKLLEYISENETSDIPIVSSTYFISTMPHTSKIDQDLWLEILIKLSLSIEKGFPELVMKSNTSKEMIKFQSALFKLANHLEMSEGYSNLVLANQIRNIQAYLLTRYLLSNQDDLTTVREALTYIYPPKINFVDTASQLIKQDPEIENQEDLIKNVDPNNNIMQQILSLEPIDTPFGFFSKDDFPYIEDQKKFNLLLKKPNVQMLIFSQLQTFTLVSYNIEGTLCYLEKGGKFKVSPNEFRRILKHDSSKFIDIIKGGAFGVLSINELIEFHNNPSHYLGFEYKPENQITLPDIQSNITNLTYEVEPQPATMTNLTSEKITPPHIIVEPEKQEEVYGLTKRNWLSALMIAGGGALLVMTLLYAFWPRQK